MDKELSDDLERIDEEINTATSRLSLISSTKKKEPPRMLIYGVHGIGKSTFASNKKFKPIFLPTEDGLAGLEVDAFPLAKTWEDVLLNVSSLLREEHGYKTLVLDSIDWAEKLIQADVAKELNFTDISDVPYGRGYNHAVSKCKRLLTGLNKLREEKKMQIILIGHALVKRFDSPITEPYDRYRPALHDKVAQMVQEWCDVVGFVNYRTVIKKTDVGFGQEKSRAIGSGERVLFLEERPAFQAKNRYSLPPEVDFDLDNLVNLIMKKGDK